MKKISFLLFLAAMIISGCQPKVESEPVDLDVAKTELNTLTDSYFDAWKKRDVAALENMIADWGLYCGTDPKEIWKKDEVIDLWKQYFTDTIATFEYSSLNREINVSPCGLTAVIMNQGTYAEWSPNIPIRQTFHAIKIENEWKIVFINWSFVAKNEDVGKLNKALDL